VVSRWASIAWRATGACGLLAALASSAWAEAQSIPSIPPVAPAELGNGPKDEVAQLERIRSALKAHYRPDNDDTRFIIDRNDKGIFGAVGEVGVVFFSADNQLRKTAIRTAAKISDCFALTAYHALEGREIVDGDKAPLTSRKVKFASGPVRNKLDGFSTRGVEAVVHDAGLLNFGNRKWADDMVLIRFSSKARLQPASLQLEHIFGRKLPTEPFRSSSFFMSVGYSTDYLSQTHRFDLLADLCSIKDVDAEVGIISDCVLTDGMSGGPLILFEPTSLGHHTARIVGVAAQSVGAGLFSKRSNGSSTFAFLSPIKITKIRAIIDRPTDNHCMPTDGKPW